MTIYVTGGKWLPPESKDTMYDEEVEYDSKHAHEIINRGKTYVCR